MCEREREKAIVQGWASETLSVPMWCVCVCVREKAIVQGWASETLSVPVCERKKAIVPVCVCERERRL